MSQDTISAALVAAREFGRRIYPDAFHPVAYHADKVRVTKEYMLYIVDEIGEVLRELEWKSHRQEGKSFSRQNLLEELIDIFKFWAGVAATWGFTADEVDVEFWRKTDVVIQRYEQERDLAQTTQHLAVVDIDGVLADYPASFERFVGAPLDTLSGMQRARWKHAYREQGFEGEHVSPRPEAAEFVRRLREWGFFVVALTSRPYAKYKRMFGDTLAFMRRHGIAVDAIIFDEDKAGFVLRQMDAGKTVALFVDDDDAHLRKVEALGVTVFKPDGSLLETIRNPEEVGRS